MVKILCLMSKTLGKFVFLVQTCGTNPPGLLALPTCLPFPAFCFDSFSRQSLEIPLPAAVFTDPDFVRVDYPIMCAPINREYRRGINRLLICEITNTASALPDNPVSSRLVTAKYCYSGIWREMTLPHKYDPLYIFILMQCVNP